MWTTTIRHELRTTRSTTVDQNKATDHRAAGTELGPSRVAGRGPSQIRIRATCSHHRAESTPVGDFDHFRSADVLMGHAPRTNLRARDRTRDRRLRIPPQHDQVVLGHVPVQTPLHNQVCVKEGTGMGGNRFEYPYRHRQEHACRSIPHRERTPRVRSRVLGPHSRDDARIAANDSEQPQVHDPA